MDLIIGIIIGAVFAPFWIKAFGFIKEKVQKLMNK